MMTVIKGRNAPIGKQVPCGYLLRSDTGKDMAIQDDWNFPGVASAFGFVACECGETDGTVDCAHKTADDMIQAAAEWLDAHEGEWVEDLGYFS